jgi:hypothetical protein
VTIQGSGNGVLPFDPDIAGDWFGRTVSVDFTEDERKEGRVAFFIMIS